MAAGKVALKIEQGATFSVKITWKDKATGIPRNLTGFTARMHIRASVQATTTLYELTTANGKITFPDAANGVTLLTIPAADTALFSWKSGVYDLELEDPSARVTRLMEGLVSVSPNVTR